MPAPLSDSFPYILISVSPKWLRVLAVLRTAQLGPPRLYVEKRPIHERDPEITFRSGVEEYPDHNDALVILAWIANA
ncbi:hypothetical protein GW17_00043637 [Ensete ventricosum]|nr:hypothetical protein GW17_00043637 [Ensete ventricosum]